MWTWLERLWIGKKRPTDDPPMVDSDAPNYEAPAHKPPLVHKPGQPYTPVDGTVGADDVRDKPRTKRAPKLATKR